MKTLGFTLAALFVATSVLAQTPGDYDLYVYSPPGSPNAMSTRRITGAQAPCAPAPPITAASVNPDVWTWEDLTCASQARVYNDAAYLAGLPDGSYAGTIRMIVNGVAGPESPAYPFSRLRPMPPPPAVMQLRIIRVAPVLP